MAKPGKRKGHIMRGTIRVATSCCLVCGIVLNPFCWAAAQEDAGLSLILIGGQTVHDDPFEAQFIVAGRDITSELKRLRRPHGTSNTRATVTKSSTIDAKEAVVTDTSRSEGIVQLEAKLRQKIDIDLEEITLEELRVWLARELDTNVRFHGQALSDEGIDTDFETVTIQGRQISYFAALKHHLAEKSLSFTVADELLTITSQDDAEENLVERVYPVWDLVKTSGGDGVDTMNVVSLMKTLTSTVLPNSWSRVGGPAELRLYKGLLVISQTTPAHESISRTLTAIRRVPVVDELEASRSTSVGSIANVSPAMEAALKRTVDAEFEDEELSSVVGKLLGDAKLPYFVDYGALEDEGVRFNDHTVSANLRGLTLGRTLNLILSELELAWTIKDEVIVIVSHDKAEDALTTRVYRVTDLLDNPRDPTDALELIKTVQAHCSPNTWDPVGGAGVSAYLPQRAALVVSTTREVHQQVDSLLQLLLRGRQGTNAAPPTMKRPDAVVTRLYELKEGFHGKEARLGLVNFFEHALRDSDNSVNSDTGFTVEMVGTRLMITHRRDAHEPLVQILDKLNAIGVGMAEMDSGSGDDFGGNFGGGFGGDSGAKIGGGMF